MRTWLAAAQRLKMETPVAPGTPGTIRRLPMRINIRMVIGNNHSNRRFVGRAALSPFSNHR